MKVLRRFTLKIIPDPAVIVDVHKLMFSRSSRSFFFRETSGFCWDLQPIPQSEPADNYHNEMMELQEPWPAICCFTLWIPDWNIFTDLFSPWGSVWVFITSEKRLNLNVRRFFAERFCFFAFLRRWWQTLLSNCCTTIPHGVLESVQLSRRRSETPCRCQHVIGCCCQSFDGGVVRNALQLLPHGRSKVSKKLEAKRIIWDFCLLNLCLCAGTRLCLSSARVSQSGLGSGPEGDLEVDVGAQMFTVFWKNSVCNLFKIIIILLVFRRAWRSVVLEQLLETDILFLLRARYHGSSGWTGSVCCSVAGSSEEFQFLHNFFENRNRLKLTSCSCVHSNSSGLGLPVRTLRYHHLHHHHHQLQFCFWSAV